MIYYYSLFGLSVSSEIEFDELLTQPKPSRIDVSLSIAPLELPSNLKDSKNKIASIVNEDYYFLNLADFAKIEARHNENTEIYLDILDESQMSIIKSWLFGSVFTAVLQMNNRFAFHASAVNTKKGVVLFCGRSGIGKSTIATRLNNHGYDIVSDDKAVLTYDQAEDKIYIEPSIQITRLWKDSIEKLEDDSFLEQPESVTLKEDKFQFLIKEENRLSEPLPVRAIFIMFEIEEKHNIMIRPLRGNLKVKRLKGQIHRPHFVEKLNKREECWHHLQLIVSKIPVSSILRPVNTKHEDFTEYILEVISE